MEDLGSEEDMEEDPCSGSSPCRGEKTKVGQEGGKDEESEEEEMEIDVCSGPSYKQGGVGSSSQPRQVPVDLLYGESKQYTLQYPLQEPEEMDTSTKESCRYGSRCYRRKEQHLLHYRHEHCEYDYTAIRQLYVHIMIFQFSSGSTWFSLFLQS